MRLQPPPFTQKIMDAQSTIPEVWKRWMLSIQQELNTGVAPGNAQFWVSTANGDLTNDRNLGLLASGYLKITTAIGVATPSTVTVIPTADLSGTLAAAQEPAHNGDVTNTAGSLTLTIGGNVVTVAKMQQVATATVLGRSTTGTGNVEVLTALPAMSGAAVTALNGSNVSSGTVDFARLGSLTSSTYTPTLTNVANLGASTAYVCQYVRVGSVVIVSGKVDVDPTATLTLTQLGISLPIASSLAAAEQCAGTAFASGIAAQGAAIRGDAANDRAEMVWIAGDVTNQPMYFSFMYQII